MGELLVLTMFQFAIKMTQKNCFGVGYYPDAKGILALTGYSARGELVEP
jgi:hypothetical protein